MAISFKWIVTLGLHLNFHILEYFPIFSQSILNWLIKVYGVKINFAQKQSG